MRNAAIKKLVFVFSLTLSWFALSAAHGDTRFATAQAQIDSLLQQHKYQTAASYIADQKDLMAEPHFVRLYTHILTTKYVFTLNFSIFALKDLKKGQHVEDLRGKKGNYQVIGGLLDDLLYKRIKKDPDSPDLNYAVGEYLSRGSACDCRNGPLKDLSGDDSVYFLKAYQKGVADAWSLFRIGVHYQSNNKPDKAIAFYRKSLALDPSDADANYNIAAAYYGKGDDKVASQHIATAIKNYQDTDLKADAYDVQGLILVDEGKDTAAEQSLRQALKLKSWHVDAFSNLLALYRRTKQHAKYVKFAEDFIAMDYGNTFPFNTYLENLQQSGQNADDGKVEAHLLSLKLTNAKENGALYFNLARMADMRNDSAAALQCYQRSLAALKTQKNPPKGAIPAITQRISELEHPAKSTK